MRRLMTGMLVVILTTVLAAGSLAQDEEAGTNWHLDVIDQSTVDGEDSATQVDYAYPGVLKHEPGLPSVAQTRSALREILAQPEYNEDESEHLGENWLQKLLAWLEGILDRPGFSSSDPITIVMVVLLAAFVLYIATRVLWEVFARRDIRAEKYGDEHGREKTGLELLEAAEKSLKQGDYRLAIRYRFLALLRALEIPSMILMTNRQLARRINHRYLGADVPFADLVACYEDAWYGTLPCGAFEYKQASNLADVVERHAQEAAE